MAPGPVATANRPMAKPSKVRYFKGKAPEAAMSDSDESDDEEERQKAPEPVKIDKNIVAGGAGRIISQDVAAQPKMKVALRDVKLEGGRVVLPKAPKQEESSEEEESEEEESEEEAPKPKFGVPKMPASEESSEYETDSEEESEEEQKPAFRPVFIKKDARGMTQEKAAAEAEAKLKEAEELEAQRKLDSKELAGETIRRELAEREAVDLQPDVDDTDGLDPSAEFDAWRARELGRLLRDKNAQAERDQEKEEIERRRALPEEQRLREDMEHAAKTREREKGEMGFLQKYYHKGAFHQDDQILNRDYTAATESAVDMSNLPSVMQVRDFGKRSRTKYTHLTDQDTSGLGSGTSWGTGSRNFGMPTQAGGQVQQGCWNCGGPHLRKDCPNDSFNGVEGFGPHGDSSGVGRGANNSNLGSSSREWGGGQRDGGSGSRYREGRERRYDEERSSRRERDRHDDRDDYRSRDHRRDDDRGYAGDRGHDDRRNRKRDRSYSPKGRDHDGHRDDRDRRRDRDRDRDREDRSRR